MTMCSLDVCSNGQFSALRLAQAFLFFRWQRSGESGVLQSAGRWGGGRHRNVAEVGVADTRRRLRHWDCRDWLSPAETKMFSS